MSSADGILIAIEGIDGAGKTTQVKRLAQKFESAGEQVVTSKEPTDGQWGTTLRRSAATGRLPLNEELELFIKDRKEHLEKLIAPSLELGKIVLLDRYFYSTIAYQGSRGASWQEIESQMSFALVPDVVFVLDASPAITISRIADNRNEVPNEFEKSETLTACREIFNQLAEIRPEVMKVDAAQSEDAVEQSILSLLLDRVFLKKRCAKPNGCDVFNCSYRQANQCRWAHLKSELEKYALKRTLGRA